MSDEKALKSEYGSRAHLIEEAFACHAVEGNLVTEQHIEMFAMFEREGFTDEQRIEYIAKLAAKAGQSVEAAE